MQEITESARFFSSTKRASRMDITQGELGDCWFLAAIGALTQHTDLLRHVIPDYDNFVQCSGFDTDDGYTGVFR
jgi:hypothetical protein